jgi:hypothetical protein
VLFEYLEERLFCSFENEAESEEAWFQELKLETVEVDPAPGVDTRAATGRGPWIISPF